MNNHSKMILAALALSAGSVALADTIHIKPGQCIMVGTQEVCALKDDAATTPATVANLKTIKVCRWGMHAKSDPPIKGWGLYLVSIKPDGTTIDTLLKNYETEKAACEKAAKDTSTPQ